MISRPFVGLALAAAVAFSGPALAKDRANPIKMFDSDNDGTLDMAEVKKAASAMFAKLDPDRDGTLDARELRGRLSARELAAADPDHDGTLTLDEYLAVVGALFVGVLDRIAVYIEELNISAEVAVGPVLYVEGKFRIRVKGERTTVNVEAVGRRLVAEVPLEAVGCCHFHCRRSLRLDIRLLRRSNTVLDGPRFAV